ncbi:hypothetical protein GF359_07965 [candidate division WOR-3 bacterium]|uniref:CoA activase n=1 Tax=candidate division WOR-3 bacterium TaxID=2052148 RepID=A0A9D5KCI8_UNCW3|nr:hypothetical protein [candidate division WOR-3 bacterium]MBD3365136.1 hypothetical protein [candidate division WOR-3 bacterium]
MKNRRIGIDAGSSYLKVVRLTGNDRPEEICYQLHKGEPLSALREIVKQWKGRFRVGVTGFYADLISSALEIHPVDRVKSLIRYVNQTAPGATSIIDVGAKGSRFIELENGRFRHFSQNSLCAAGTGSFLDQQAERLGLSYADLADYPCIPDPPRIAARCSVFAKTDLIHRQQEGYTKAQMWNGLCRGMAANLVQTLLRGRIISKKIVLTGGVALNRWVVEWLIKDLPGLEVLPHAHLASAAGAAMHAERKVDLSNLDIANTTTVSTAEPLRPRLELARSTYPDFGTTDEWVDENETDIRVIKKPSTSDFYLGIDIGSTSTKAVLINRSDEIVADFYRKTTGDPIKATTLVFSAIEELSSKYELEPRILGAGTTGSGRRIVGLVTGADAVTNEITCHARGALKLDPEISTIFELGGQDSKFIRLENGSIVESNLNYICAAGTGSFVEEQAARLGIKLADSGPRSMGKEAPYTSDRCTVFMEEDVERLLAKGFSKEEVMAAVLHSVVQNYLTKVVENRPVKPKIAFQGATARNVGLVAAFENYLDEEILVSPYCHVLGAYGAALIAREQVKGSTGFLGLDLHKRKIELTTEECPYCANHCTITFANVEGLAERPSWGYLCGKEPGEKRMRRDENYRLFEKRQNFLGETGEVNFQKTIGLPMVLGFYTYLPFWQRFFNSLGYNVVTTGATSEDIISEGGKLASADFCLPVKVVYGHFAKLLNMNPDFILLPHMLTMADGDYYSYVCPYGQSFPGLLPSIPGYDGGKVISPLLDMTWAEGENLAELHKAVTEKLNVSREQVKKAWDAGWKAYNLFTSRCSREGAEFLSNLDGKAILLLGRPYSLFDDRISASLARQIARTLKIPVIPPEFIPADDNVRWQDHRMFWDYGQSILSALKYASRHPDIYPVYITHFACGPDSCLITMAEEIMKGKPFMILEVDEHSSAGGYTTRIEAFAESIRSYKPSPRPQFNLPAWPKRIPSYTHRKVWIPPMHPVGSRFFAAVFRRHGIDAEALPPTDRDALNIGKALTLGKECMPAVVTIGTFIKKMRDDSLDPAKQAFFMPSSDGPCRFGQYVNLHRIILDREGYKNVDIINPSSYNSYAGLTRRIRLDLWKASLYSDFLVKLRCKVKPYEINPGLTEEAYLKSITRIEHAIETGRAESGFRTVVSDFESIPVSGIGTKPLVGVVGEIYVRLDPFSNENVVEYIETQGAEVWLSPASEFLLYSIFSQNVRAGRQKDTSSLISGKVTSWITQSDEHKLERITRNLLSDRREPSIAEVRKRTERYLPFECGTEAVLTLGRAIIFAERGASVVVNASPFTCMPGTITTAIFERVQKDYGVPVVNMFYDGEEGTNQKLGIYLRNLTFVD